MEPNEALIRQWFEEVWNQQKPEAIDNLYAADGVSYGMLELGAPMHGPEPWKAVQAAFCQALPDLKVEIQEVFTRGDSVAVRFSAWGTNTGPFQGIPASNKRVTVEGMCTAVVRDGQLIEGQNTLDMLGLLQQIGAVPSIAEIAAAKK